MSMTALLSCLAELGEGNPNRDERNNDEATAVLEENSRKKPCREDAKFVTMLQLDLELLVEASLVGSQ